MSIPSNTLFTVITFNTELNFEIWAKSNPHGPAFWRQIPREDWMRNHEWEVGQRHTFFKRKKKPKKLATI